jgi:hypothetical protein
MKNLYLIFVILLFSFFSNATVSKSSQIKFSNMLNEVGLTNTWATDSSLWVQNPGGMSKMDLEMIGNTLCGYGQGFFVVTFWHNIRAPSGEIVKVTCRS